MVSEPAPGASLDSGPCYVQGHDAFTPFAPSEMPSTVGFTQAPFGTGQSNPPMGQSASPFGTTPPMGQTAAPFGAAAAQSPTATDDDKDAWYNKAPSYSSGRRRDRGPILKIIMLLVKLMPAAMVLYGGYYGYKQFFGEMSAEELAAYYGPSGAPGSSGGAAGANGAAGLAGGDAVDGPKSRVGIMLQQAKDSIAAHDQNVHMANAIADNPSNLDDIQASLDNIEAQMAAQAAPAAAKPEPKVKLAFSDGPVGGTAVPGATDNRSQAEQALTNFTGPMSTVGRENGSSAQGTVSVAIAAPELSNKQASPEFRAWVSRISVSGVRVGSDPRAFVGGRLVRPGMTVDHRLGIHFSHIGETDRLLYFEDSSGAVLAKRY